mmetsp:Transcript_20338/g.25143  ORF Transcript_20338/g.25143 Transcript_20338/m.25143 type:complete len:133 (+) Transcript_20338:17-415(+)
MTVKSWESLVGTEVSFSKDDDLECNSREIDNSEKEPISISSCIIQSKTIASGLIFGDLGSNDVKIKITSLSGSFSCRSSLSSQDSIPSPMVITSGFDNGTPINERSRQKQTRRAKATSKRREVHPSMLSKWR